MRILEIIFLPSINMSVLQENTANEYVFQDMVEEKRKLYEIIGSKITTDNLLGSEPIPPELFSIKFVMSEHKTLARVLISVCAPVNVSRMLRSKAIYSHINWQKMFTHKIKKGDSMVIPITLISIDKNVQLYDYTQDQLSEILVFRLTK